MPYQLQLARAQSDIPVTYSNPAEPISQLVELKAKKPAAKKTGNKKKKLPTGNNDIDIWLPSRADFSNVQDYEKALQR